MDVRGMNSSNTRFLYCWMSFPNWILLAAEDPPFSFVPRCEGFGTSTLCAEWQKNEWSSNEWSGTIYHNGQKILAFAEYYYGHWLASSTTRTCGETTKTCSEVLICVPATFLHFRTSSMSPWDQKHQTTRKHSSGFEHAWRVFLEVRRSALIGKADCR